MFSLYSNMLAAAIPQLQQVRTSSDLQNLVASLFFHVKEFAHNSLTYIIFWTEDDNQVYLILRHSTMDLLEALII